MNQINLITPPDKLFNNHSNILLICHSNEIKQQVQDILATATTSINIYIYDSIEQDIDWLLTVSFMSDLVILDLDNSTTEVKCLASYILGNTATYWLTDQENIVYNHINKNRVYDLEILHKLLKEK